MSQPIFTPEIMDCHCGSKARLIDWDFRDMWRVMCDKNHTRTPEYQTKNRAVHKWNNKIKALARNHPRTQWHTERQDSGILLIVTHNGQQWARLIRDAEYRDHYDRHFLVWMAILNLKYSALGMWKSRRTILDFAGIDQ